MIKVLFLCTGNAARSQMAEGLINHDFTDQVQARSAGITPKGVSELAIRVMAEAGIDISHHTSDHLDAFADEPFDYIITLCGNADSNCPRGFGTGERIHMGFDDPPHSNTPSEENLLIYRRVRDQIRTVLGDFFTRKLVK